MNHNTTRYIVGGSRANSSNPIYTYENLTNEQLSQLLIARWNHEQAMKVINTKPS